MALTHVLADDETLREFVMLELPVAKLDTVPEVVTDAHAVGAAEELAHNVTEEDVLGDGVTELDAHKELASDADVDELSDKDAELQGDWVEMGEPLGNSEALPSGEALHTVVADVETLPEEDWS